MGRISELKRYLSILASPTPRDITDTLSVDHDKENRVEDEMPCSLNFRYELTVGATVQRMLLSSA